MPKKPAWGDFVLIALFLLFTIFAFFFSFRGNSVTRKLIIYSGEDEYLYPLDRDGTYRIKGRLGESVICVQEGKAFFSESPCPNKICVETGKISRSGDFAACLPNDVMIVIDGGEEELDAFSE